MGDRLVVYGRGVEKGCWVRGSGILSTIVAKEPHPLLLGGGVRVTTLCWKAMSASAMYDKVSVSTRPCGAITSLAISLEALTRMSSFHWSTFSGSSSCSGDVRFCACFSCCKRAAICASFYKMIALGLKKIAAALGAAFAVATVRLVVASVVPREGSSPCGLQKLQCCDSLAVSAIV